MTIAVTPSGGTKKRAYLNMNYMRIEPGEAVLYCIAGRWGAGVVDAIVDNGAKVGVMHFSVTDIAARVPDGVDGAFVAAVLNAHESEHGDKIAVARLERDEAVRRSIAAAGITDARPSLLP